MTFAKNTEMKKLELFIRKVYAKTNDFDTIIKTIKNIFVKPLAVAVESFKYTQHWSASVGE